MIKQKSTAVFSVANYMYILYPNTLNKSLSFSEKKGERSLSGAFRLHSALNSNKKTVANAQRPFSSTVDCLITLITMTHQRKMD